MTPDAEWTIERHLEGQPEFAVELFDRFIELVSTFGPFTYAVSKSSITLKGSRRGFAGARPVTAGLRGKATATDVVSASRLVASAATASGKNGSCFASTVMSASNPAVSAARAADPV